MKQLYVIAGPTAVGKTATAIALAQQLGTDIISADSRQCYREMNIGVARPSEAELAAIKHYFIASHSITAPVTAADFEQLALGWLDQIFEEKESAVVCGGTGLYIKALCEGLDEMPAVPQEVKVALQAEFTEKGLAWLQQAVAAADPLFAAGGEMQNPARLLRALSFWRATGQSIVAYRSGRVKQRPFQIIKVALDLPRPLLYERIGLRVNQMMEAGLLEEVKQLLPYKGLSPLQTVGYQELFDFLEGRLDLPAAVDLIARHTRNYAKRQLTWLRKDPQYHWLPANMPELSNVIRQL